MKEQVLDRLDAERREALRDPRADTAQPGDGQLVRSVAAAHAVDGAAQASSTITPSISTLVPFGRADTPTAARAG